MIYDLDMIRTFYATYMERIKNVRKQIGKPLTYAEKVLFAHLADSSTLQKGGFKRGQDYAQFYPCTWYSSAIAASIHKWPFCSL